MGLKIVEWPTPISLAKRVSVNKIVYEENFEVFCVAFFDQEEKEFIVNFGSRPIFRVIQEEFLTSFWEIRNKSAPDVGWTIILQQSNWLEELGKDFLFTGLRKGSEHFVITSDDIVIEVISVNDPIFKVV